MNFEPFPTLLSITLVLNITASPSFDLSMCGYKRNGRPGNQIKLGMETNMRSEGRAETLPAIQQAFIISGRKVLWGFLIHSIFYVFLFLFLFFS